METLGHVRKALLEEMKDVKGSACFENCETELRSSMCIRQGGVEVSVLWSRVTKIRTVESRDEMEGQMLVNRVWRTRGTNVSSVV